MGVPPQRQGVREVAVRRAGWTQLTPVQSLYVAGIAMFALVYVLARCLAWIGLDFHPTRSHYSWDLIYLWRIGVVGLITGAAALMVAALWMHDHERGIAIPHMLPVEGRWLVAALITFGSFLPLFLPALLPPVRGVGAEAFTFSLGPITFTLCLLQMTPAFILLSWLQARAAPPVDHRNR